MSGRLKIGELAKRSGTTTKTVRYYELLGLLHEPERTESGYRLYDDKDVERLTFIRKAKSLGFSLTEIGEPVGPPAGSREAARVDSLPRAEPGKTLSNHLAGALPR